MARNEGALATMYGSEALAVKHRNVALLGLEMDATSTPADFRA